jgi:Family of unknown function (DUF5989)
MSKQTVLRDLWDFLLAEKKYWLLPIVLMFVLLGLVIAVAQTTAIAPFIYTLF